jgi:hypothetical protein
VRENKWSLPEMDMNQLRDRTRGIYRKDGYESAERKGHELVAKENTWLFTGRMK